MGIFDKIKSSLSDTFGDAFEGTPLDKLSSYVSSTGKKPSVLETPPPPAVPEPQQAMSVMVAVNGQSYGPYERATLLKMIDDGSLTPQTFVFINGMSDWQPAQRVPEVASLFNIGSPAPAVPPVPWTSAVPEAPGSSAQSDSHFSPKLDKLITAAVADGEITDLERQVLIRNAQEEGVAMDEFVMVLEARLFEQRQVLSARQKQQSAPMRMPPPQPAAPQQTSRANKVDKCPSCGAPIKAMATECPECGYEYNANTHGECTAWERLHNMLLKVDNEKAKGLIGGYLAIMGSDSQSPAKIEKKKSIIKNFLIPSDKLGILDFFVSCATIANDGNLFTKDPLAGAYKTKAKQVLTKARIIMKDDPKMLEELNSLAAKYKIKA